MEVDTAEVNCCVNLLKCPIHAISVSQKLTKWLGTQPGCQLRVLVRSPHYSVAILKCPIMVPI